MRYTYSEGVIDNRNMLYVAFAAVLSIVALWLGVISPASAATSNVDCADLPAAIASASAGDTLVVSGQCTLTTNTVVNKQLTIQGTDDLVISTNGTAQIFTVTADGTTLDNLTVVKTDKTGTQNIIGIQADNVSVTNSTFSGQYVLGDPEVARALEVSSVDNFTFSGNTVTGLRQPAYINTATGSVTNNYVSGTRGFVVVADSNVTFSGNSWGTNAVDIAIIDNDANPATPVTNNYPCPVLKQIRMANNNARIDNQVLSSPCPTYPMTADECKNNNWKTFTEVTFKNQGQCVASVVSSPNSKLNR